MGHAEALSIGDGMTERSFVGLLSPDTHPYAYLNEYVCASVTGDVIARLIRRHLEVRRLRRIGVLPVGWDEFGRHHTR
jgi:hypothetical protein